MNKQAIEHIPLSRYAYALDEYHLVIRLRTAKGDLSRCVLYYGDRVDPVPQVRMTAVPMEIAGQDQYFDYYEAHIEDKYTRVCYYFEIDDGRETLYICERGLVSEMDCSRTEYFQFPFNRREDIIDIPSWWEDCVMYHIFPDSFATEHKAITGQGKNLEITLADGTVAKSRSKQGGTLKGITANVDYLAKLGINCIYMNPIFVANSYHKYDTVDYLSVDPCFGTLEDLKELVKTCHSNGIKVIFDGVFNHTGPDFFAFADVLKNGKGSKYYDWFYDLPDVVEYKDPPKYACFAYVKEMPKTNTSNPDMEAYFIKVGTYWIEEVGIDGWRLDVANEINHDFWRHFRAAVRKVKPDALLIGEIWEDAGVWLMGDQMDSTMNYRFVYLCTDFFAKGQMKASTFDESMNKMIFRYPDVVARAQMNMLDSHDVPRFLSFCNGDRRRMELAFFYLLCGYGIPSIFYGDEHFLEGMDEDGYRQPMKWNCQDTAFDKFSTWIALRKEHESLKKGDYRRVYVDDEKGVYVFSRKTSNEKAIIAINNSDMEYLVSAEMAEAVAKAGGSVKVGDVMAPFGYNYQFV